MNNLNNTESTKSLMKSPRSSESGNRMISRTGGIMMFCEGTTTHNIIMKYFKETGLLPVDRLVPLHPRKGSPTSNKQSVIKAVEEDASSIGVVDLDYDCKSKYHQLDRIFPIDYYAIENLILVNSLMLKGIFGKFISDRGFGVTNIVHKKIEFEYDPVRRKEKIPELNKIYCCCKNVEHTQYEAILSQRVKCWESLYKYKCIKKCLLKVCSCVGIQLYQSVLEKDAFFDGVDVFDGETIFKISNFYGKIRGCE